jgi:hypothetical protein
MSTLRVQAYDQVGRYFGGVYDPVNRCYRDALGPNTATNIPLVGTLRTKVVKRYPDSDHTYGLPAGGNTGGYALVHISRQQRDSRLTTGPGLRLKNSLFEIDLYLFILSKAERIEDMQDDLDMIDDAVTTLIDQDRRLRPSPTDDDGIFTNVGEDEAGVEIVYGMPVTKGEITRTTVQVSFTASAYEWA